MVRALRRRFLPPARVVLAPAPEKSVVAVAAPAAAASAMVASAAFVAPAACTFRPAALRAASGSLRGRALRTTASATAAPPAPAWPGLSLRTTARGTSLLTAIGRRLIGPRRLGAFRLPALSRLLLTWGLARTCRTASAAATPTAATPPAACAGRPLPRPSGPLGSRWWCAALRGFHGSSRGSGIYR